MSAGLYLMDAPSATPGKKELVQLFEAAGGETDWTVNLGAETYTATPPTDDLWIVERVVVFINGDLVMAPDEFAGTAAVLGAGTGITFKWRHDPAGAGVADYVDLLDGLEIRQNSHFMRAGFRFEEFTTGAGDRTHGWVFDFAEVCGAPIQLDGGAAVGSFLEFDVGETLSGVVDIRAEVHGWEI